MKDLVTFSAKLAVRIGLKKAICMQKLDDCLEQKVHMFSDITFFEEKKWVLKNYEEWHKDLPFMSVGAIKAHFKDLKKRGLVLCRRYWRNRYYSINYNALEKLYK